MRAIRDVWSELVERRLWPVALLLIVALVAVPVVLAKKPPAQPAVPAVGPDPSPVPAVAAHAPGEPIVSVTSVDDAGAPLIGRVKDPFRQQYVPHRVVTATAAPGSSSSQPAGAGGSGRSGPTGPGAPRRSGKPAPRTYVYASVDVSFGRAGSPLRAITDVPRLAPLPSATDPVVIFMGTRKDHETAVFMVSTDVHAQGDGRCVPSTKTCESIELRRGGVALLDVTDTNGYVTQYELDLDDVALHTTTSKATASAAAVAAHLAWAQREGAAPGGPAPQASAGAAPRAPVLMPLP